MAEQPTPAGDLQLERVGNRTTIRVPAEHSHALRRFFEHKGAVGTLLGRPGTGMDVLGFNEEHDAEELRRHLDEWKRSFAEGV